METKTPSFALYIWWDSSFEKKKKNVQIKVLEMPKEILQQKSWRMKAEKKVIGPSAERANTTEKVLMAFSAKPSLKVPFIANHLRSMSTYWKRAYSEEVYMI